MAELSIRAENLSKQFVIGEKRDRYNTLRESLTKSVTAPWRKLRNGFNGLRSTPTSNQNSIWALKDVSFTVNRGEVIGIIGRNGAGKSTLLKVLSRISEPTSGFADLYGRVGSLLEVGTGFHPELTGRENIYLNGAILGMLRSEIDRKFDQIVDFAEVETFIETPVKRYSSGMYLRLAFAVAAHLEPEILLVDEVLAVGDTAFQKKCLGRMDEVAQEGRTVLFVSHNMGAVRALCSRGLVLDHGGVAYSGPINQCIQQYYQSVGAIEDAEPDDTFATSGRAGFSRISIDGSQGNTVHQADQFEASTQLRLADDAGGFSIFCIVEDMYGRQLVHIRDESPQLGLKEVRAGHYRINIRFPALWLNPGLYTLYFKAILWGGWGSSRHVSDKFPLDINGNSSLSDSVLHPDVCWDVAADRSPLMAGPTTRDARLLTNDS